MKTSGACREKYQDQKGLFNEEKKMLVQALQYTAF